jgi:hypothetical protein
MKKDEYVSKVNSSTSNAIEEYVQKVYTHVKQKSESLPYKLPYDLEPENLDFNKVVDRFSKDGWNFVKKDFTEDYRSWSHYILQ